MGAQSPTKPPEAPAQRPVLTFVGSSYIVRRVNVRSRHQVFAPGELPLVILALAEQGPLKAYELLAELGRRFGPSYRPSPGAVYPALDALLAEKLLVAAQDGRGKRYSLTARGVSVLEQRRPQLVAIENRTGTRLTDGDALRSLLERVGERVMRREGQLDLDQVERALQSAEKQMTTPRSEHAEI